MFPEPDNELEAGDERVMRQTRSLPAGKPQSGQAGPDREPLWMGIMGASPSNES